MSALNHPEYKEELEKLSYVHDYLKGYNEKIAREKQKIDKDVDYSITHYNSDNAEQFNELMINTTLQDNLNQKLKNIHKSLSTPYFARVDFKEENSSKAEKIYIGKMSLMRSEDNEMLITDWRAPVATLYYEGRIGEAVYESPTGNVNCNINLKRQYEIKNGQLKEIYDIDITTNDEFLQASLGSSKDKRLKDIVSTIQAEQNKVIRANMWKPLIVQGAAGGGKTTIALHRIAYLLYNHENALSPRNFMIIAPNKFFLSYISEVLPDLGVENVVQTTFEDLALDIIGAKLKIRPSYEKLSYFIEDTSIENKKVKEDLKKISRFKSSLYFMHIIKNYVRQIEYALLPKEDFKIDSFTLIPNKELKRFFHKEYSYLPLKKRINELKKNLTNTLRQRKKPILEEIELKYDREINDVRESMKDCPERRQRIIELADKRDRLLEKIRKESKTIIREYLGKIHFSSPYDYYKALIDNKEKFQECSKGILKPDSAEILRRHTKKVLESNFLEIEDLAPLMYIKYFIHGLEDKFTVRHILIDEAQDFSLFQLYILKQIMGSSSFTILGDLFQGIHSYRGIKNWQEVIDLIFKEDSASFLTLEQSYRTTVEIMNAANLVVKNLNKPDVPLAKPVIRHGEAVEIIEKNDFDELIWEISNKINEIQKESFKSAAIICKTLEECKVFKDRLNSLKVNCSLITGSEKEYSGGIVVIPSYHVKGLEFDAVIVANASKEAYTKTELDTKLLYIAMTRPLHRLYIYSLGEKSELLKFI